MSKKQFLPLPNFLSYKPYNPSQNEKNRQMIKNSFLLPKKEDESDVEIVISKIRDTNQRILSEFTKNITAFNCDGDQQLTKMEKVIKLILPCTIVPFSIYQDGLIKIYNFFKGQNLQLWKEKEGIISPDVFLSMRYHLDSIIQLHLKIAPIETLKNCIDAYSSSLEKLQVSLKGMLNEFYIF